MQISETVAGSRHESEQAPRVPSGVGASITSRIGEHAANQPARLAVAEGQSRLTYGDLESRSNQLAAYLRKIGIAPESCIGLLFDRSVDFVVAALAVMKAGGAYLPLDSSTPPERVTSILAEESAPIVLTHCAKARKVAPGACRVIELDGAADSARIASLPAASASFHPPAGNLAYIIYTSGSTGRPKGVELTHANLLNLIDWHQQAFAVGPDDRASQVAGLGFDAATWEIWPYLTAGASLHLADELTRRSPQALRDWMVAEQITIGFVPTVLAEQLLCATWPAETKLRALLTGADTLHRRPAAGLPFTLINNYGPTECTVVATSGAVDPDATADGPPSIGRAITNTSALILDDSLRPVAAGEPGELCLAGAHVGRGYRNDPALTASRFVTVKLPDSEAPIRIYRTGDRARLLPNGEIAFLGRVDDQVKIRGYRVELGEIAAWLDKIPGIQANAVVTSKGEGGAELLAYVVVDPQRKLSASDLREFLSSRLPDYMIPARYVALKELPTTANGKLDKAALPAPTANNLLNGGAKAIDSASASAPASELEHRIAGIVASLLGQPSVAREDNFFMLGGHSMLGVQLVARVRDAFGVKLTLRQLFGAPTIEALAREVAANKPA